MLVVDEPVAVENFLAGAFQTLEDRYAETDAADDLGLRPDELYSDRRRIARTRSMRGSAWRCERWVALQRSSIRRSRSTLNSQRFPSAKNARTKQPLFLFPHVDAAGHGCVPAEVEWKAQSVMRYHGRLPDLARDVMQPARESQATTLFVMPSSRRRRTGRGNPARIRSQRAPDFVRRTSPNSIGIALMRWLPAANFPVDSSCPQRDLVVHVEGDLFDEAAEPALERRATAIKREKKRRARARSFSLRLS